MQILYSLVSFIIAIGVLVTVHEFGHFWVARKLGVKVLRFSVGFGRPIWIRRGAVDDTEYVLAAIPLGGYVKMLDEGEGDVSGHEVHRAFNRQSLWKRVAIVLAGPVANFLFAIVAYALMFMIGVSGLKAIVGEVQPGTVAAIAGFEAGEQIVAIDERPVGTWESVIQAVLGESLDGQLTPVVVRTPDAVSRTRNLDLTAVKIDDLTQGQFFNALGLSPGRPVIDARIGVVEAGGAGDSAGLRPGDLILIADGEPIANWGAWVQFVQQRPEQAIATVVQRGEAQQKLTITPATFVVGERTIGRIGVGVEQGTADAAYSDYYLNEQLGPLDALHKGAVTTYDMSMLTVHMFWKMLTLDVSVKNLSGPISIAQYAGASAQGGFSRFLQFLAIVSVSLGILNLLPVPLLDGGHLLYYAVETVLGRPLSDEAQFTGQRIGITLLVGLMGLAFYNDLSRLFG
ncbi:MAG: regulator of sigma E protease [Gammaproteobacteria bacterium]|jgi:regulator of sigma E protease